MVSVVLGFSRDGAARHCQRPPCSTKLVELGRKWAELSAAVVELCNFKSGQDVVVKSKINYFIGEITFSDNRQTAQLFQRWDQNVCTMLVNLCQLA